MVSLTYTLEAAGCLTESRNGFPYPVLQQQFPENRSPNMSLYHEQKADSPTLKRAFFTSNSSFPSKKLEHTFPYSNVQQPPPQSSRWTSNTSARCPRLAPSPRLRRPSMVHTTARTFMPMPSFGSVFGGELHSTEPQDSTAADGSNVVRPASSGHTASGSTFSTFHMHRDSRDSNSTTSSDNSPTTTISTMDSSSVTDPSPGPSPESPLAKTAAASSFVADFRSRRPETSSGDSSPSAFFELQRPTTPAKKARNLKNLGINTTTSLTNLRAHTPAPIAVGTKEKNSSAPPSPLFIKPPTPPKRRPSNLSLTISTPGQADNKPTRLVIPSTPSLNRPTLRHFQSSPSLPSLAGSNGMQFPTLRPIVTKGPSGLSEVPFEMEEEEDQEPNFDIPQSKEEKPAAYPNGPICIYEAGVYLYFEPTAEQAATFDVIINVASEVKNPFTSAPSESQKDLDARRVDGPPAESVDFASLPQRAKPVTSFGMDDNSPTTPKATPVMQTIQPGEITIDGKTYKTPEYIHMPWEHNTDIVSDLYRLVKMMDERVQQGKRVLIHCQCGVSRSASLIVAYGLYKDPHMSVQEAYDRAKKRSRWIGPNMNLIMQLQEFRNGLLRANESRNQGFGRRSAGLTTARSTGKYSPFERETGSGSRTPRTAPLPPDSDISMQRASTGNMMAISPGPLSAPTGAFSPGFRRSWDVSQSHFDISAQPTPTSAPHVDTSSHSVPVVAITENKQSPAQLGSAPTSASMAMQRTEEPSLELPSAPVVPNFSRQLPLRRSELPSEISSSHLSVGLSANTLPLSLGAMRSPMVASFNIPSRNSGDYGSADIMSPVKTTFDNLWPAGYDLDSEPSSPQLTREQTAPPELASPRSSEFHMTPLKNGGIDESYGLLSPRATSFDIQVSQPSPLVDSHRSSFESAEISSPIKTQFPRDVFGRSDGITHPDVSSPRAEEFHMSPFKPEVAKDEDPFGMTSPTRFEFSSNPFDRPSLAVTHDEPEDRRPSFQAILPPAHSNFSGFASLDGTAIAQPAFSTPLPLRTLNVQGQSDSSTWSDSHEMAPAPVACDNVEPQPAIPRDFPQAPATPQTPKEVFLSTPAKGIRTRFSSPNLREQRKLHKLQTEMESKLPKKSPSPQHAADDIDALLSPRAEEFTRNPFHFNIQKADDDSSPASSNETIKDGRNGHTWDEPLPRQWTPEKSTIDPRSPVQTGSSPIVRSIWDVL